LNTKYIDTSIVLCASTKYVDYKKTAKRIIYGGITSGSTYILKISDLTFERLEKIYKRRKKIYHDHFSKVTINKCKGKTPADFMCCFTKGSTMDHLDDNQLVDMYDKILEDIHMYPTDKFDGNTAEQFCEMVYSALGHSKVDLKLLMNRINEEEEIIFTNEYEKDRNKIFVKLKKIINEKKYKIDIRIFSDYIAHGINGGMDFEIITADPFFSTPEESEKINNVIKKYYGRNYENIIVPIYNAHGSKSIQVIRDLTIKN